MKTANITSLCSGKEEIISASEINSLTSESGLIATLLEHPDFVFYADDYLKPSYFTNGDNECVYTAIRNLARKGIYNTDPYNIISYLNSSESLKTASADFITKINNLSLDKLTELFEMKDVLVRHTPEEYKMLADDIVDAAMRRDAYQKLSECQALCERRDIDDIEQKIYNVIDGVMVEFSSNKGIPEYKDVVDQCWSEIQSRQNGQYAGIPFKFKTLNEYATIEPGELFIFAAEAKQGKSIMLLNCAIDLLRQDKSVLYLDSELNTRLFTGRVLSHLSGVEYKRLTSGNYSAEEAQKIEDAKEWMKTRKFTHIYIPMFDQQSIYSAIKKVYHTQGIQVLIVDYFKGSGSGDAFDSYQELGRFVDMIKNNVCGKMDICGIGAAQATASGKVADSAKIGRNASTIALLQDKTPEEIEADGAECGNKKLRIIFNRNGMQHTDGEYIDLNFDGNHILYEEAKQHIPQIPY